ncbi:TrmO family methyltransferase domain-containing protein [Klebsiella grimontii]|uniref:TrmO family methyltransferase domain-containing protein n=1 Tax=Klebsiella grimontii TaxID=2058152 RepID=UPI001CCDC5BE|nr:TrmO family methyltransferase [Klebsiella grimontii]MBZ7211925.1 tRNA (N6-threonylcarbamoyladenosine(37)-N6)-methyltransferase TrmO [Klebsiella grimontii]
MKEINLYAIGRITLADDKVKIILHPPYRSGLKGIEGYSHVTLLRWCDGYDDKSSRQTVITSTPYTEDEMGVFATRSPQRPNTIAITTTEILHVDLNAGLLIVSWIDAENGSPVIDIKPYIPSLDRVENPITPGYLSGWPSSLEKSADFDWSSVLNY